jgi:GT2 family glycosyltransferase
VARPTVDVVVPFRGEPDQLEQVRTNLGRLSLGDGDSVQVVANEGLPGYSRNRGAERGRAEWLVFFDADTVPEPDLLDRYFEPLPGERTALLGGGVMDEPVPEDAPAAVRYAYLRELMSQENTHRFGDWSFPQAANLACRRSAFEEVGGFRENIRAGEDADLSYRLRDAGWEVERREAARVVHLNRATLRGFLTQRLIHGGGAAWLTEAYPGAFPARRRPGLVWWGVRRSLRGVTEAARSRSRDRLLWAVFEPLELITFEFGRSLPNERPLRGPWRRLASRRSRYR